MVGETFGDYELIAKLGEGGMGSVYRARHRVLGREAAIKFLLPQLSRDPALVERFLGEAQTAANIEHPGVAHIYELGVDPARGAFIVMELLRGESLQERLDLRGRLAVTEVVRLGRHLCNALRAAHDQGVIHRDLKPDNIIIVADPDVEGGERPKLLDFGIAKRTDPFAGGAKTTTATPVGTPYYMSPEQCRADPSIDGRADLYALGCVLFQCLTGRVPIDGHSTLELIEAHKSREPPAVAEHWPACPPELDRLIQRLLAKRPEDRPQSAGALHDELGSISLEPAEPAALAATQAPPRTTMRPPRSTETKGRSPWPWVGVGLAVAASITIGLVARGETTGTTDARVAPDALPAPPPVERGWVRVPGARFVMGSSAEEVAAAIELCRSEASTELCAPSLYERERPSRRVEISGFEIQEREVTNRELTAWLDAVAVDVRDDELHAGGLVLAGVGEGAGIERRGDRVVPIAGRADTPAAMVSWYGARRYCRWLGADLPTEGQWELAARGVDRRIYPWGDEPPSCDRVVFGRGDRGPCGDRPPEIAPVTSGPGDRTPEGLRGLAGNVAEWVVDELAPYVPCPEPGCRDPVLDPVEREWAVIRGGAFNDLTEGLRSANRKRAAPSELMANVGFRCARPLPPSVE